MAGILNPGNEASPTLAGVSSIAAGNTFAGLSSVVGPDDDEIEDTMCLEPPDPLDVLLAYTEDKVLSKPRPLDFVRAKLQALRKENKALKDRVADLEQTLTIVQTAQEWTVGKGMTQEQKDKMKEIQALLEQARRAREELQNFSGASRQGMYEKLRAAKGQLKREKQEKLEMRDRLVHMFDHARTIKEQHRKLADQRLEEQERWSDFVRDMRERHHRELRRLKGEGAVMEADRQDQLSHFGEQVLDGLNALQQHLHDVRHSTVDTVIVESAEIDASLPAGIAEEVMDSGGDGEGETLGNEDPNF